MLKYEHIEYLNLLFGIPILIFAILIYNRWKRKALDLFGDRKLMVTVTNEIKIWKEVLEASYKALKN